MGLVNVIIGTQPLPLLVNFIMWTQPLHHFLRIKLPSHFNLAEWGGARGEKGRIYQPHPLSDLIVGPQPLLHFLRFTITFPPWGVVGLGMKKQNLPATPVAYLHLRDTTAIPLPSTYHHIRTGKPCEHSLQNKHVSVIDVNDVDDQSGYGKKVVMMMMMRR